MTNIDSTSAQIEKRKDRLNLRPALEFVRRHIKRYENALSSLVSRPAMRLPHVLEVKFEEEDMLSEAGPQLNKEQILQAIGALPEPILELSMLECIDYNHAQTIPVPVYDLEGYWRGAVEKVELSAFPRPADHPSRILIGYSTGKIIYPTPLPESVYEGTHERWFYQLHVFLHEFFYTIEFLRRGADARRSIVLTRGAASYTLQEWWLKWEIIRMMTAKRPHFPTRYAATYANDLTPTIRKVSPVLFETALAELICESFVGYMLGVAPNDDDHPEFKSHSPAEWALIHELCTSTVGSL